jgi:hypothetical protein
MTPAAKLDRIAMRLMWIGTVLLLVQTAIYSAQRSVERAAKRMAELEGAKASSEEENARLHRGLDGALAYIHQEAGSRPDSSLDSKGSEDEASLGSQGSIQSDQA